MCSQVSRCPLLDSHLHGTKWVLNPRGKTPTWLGTWATLGPACTCEVSSSFRARQLAAWEVSHCFGHYSGFCKSPAALQAQLQAVVPVPHSQAPAKSDYVQILLPHPHEHPHDPQPGSPGPPTPPRELGGILLSCPWAADVLPRGSSVTSPTSSLPQNAANGTTKPPFLRYV